MTRWMRCAGLELAALAAVPAGAAPAQVSCLRCESRVDPLGIDTPKPRLSWQIVSDRRGEVQTAYRVLVASTPEALAADRGDLWDSDRVENDRSVCVEYAGKPLSSLMRCYWKVRVWTSKGDTWSGPAFWTLGLLKPTDWQARWIQPVSRDALRAGFLRRAFELPETPGCAVASVNSAGYAELYVNGRKVGHDVLTPAVSDHSRQTFYVTYDVASFLRKGRNVMALWLGRGWAEGAPAVRARLDATVAGRPFVLATDASWKGAASHREWIGGRKWNDFGGERVDARAKIADWDKPSFDDSAWADAAEVPGPRGAAVAQTCPVNRIGKQIPAVRVTELGPRKHEIDFGTALTGWLRLQMPALQPGTVVKMTFADVKRGAQYQDFKQVSEFISAGASGEVFEHKFNYAGFRYVVVEGLPAAPAKEDAIAMLVESDLEPAGSFACSNELLNRIHALMHWTQRCLNLGGYYVDCPHRERMGYGDGQVAAEGFMSNFRADGFYGKWLCDWRLRQGTDGKLPHMAPFGAGGGGPAWPGLLAAVTWRHYLYHGDRRVVEENFDAVRRYVDYLESLCKDGILCTYGGKWDFIGDWVSPGRGMDTKNWPDARMAELFNNCYRVYQWDLRMKMAAALDRPDEVARCREHLGRMRPAVHRAFYDAAGKRYVIDEQAYYVMPLMTGVTPESEREGVLLNLEQNILVKSKGHLDTGMLGTYFLMEYLRQIGRNDLVFTMFSRTTFPSWGHMLAEGATTCWEQWNGHWSRIHSCFTSADNWLYQGLGGIRPDPAGPGFKKTLVQPAVVGDVTWVRCHHDSPYGRIVSTWERVGAALRMDVEIPANTTATVFVPARDAASVTEGGRPADQAEGVRLLRVDGGAAVFAVGSGAYRFASTLPGAQ